MKNDSVISIIIPFYKGNRYLKQLVSMLNINYINFIKEYPDMGMEIIIVNDSPEEPVEIESDIFDFRLQIITNVSNSGIHQSRVNGLKYCVGDYVIFLDQDDVLEDNALTEQFKRVKNNSADIVVCNALIEEKNGGLVLYYKSKVDFERINDLEFYLKSHNVIKSPGQCLIRKSCIPIEWKTNIVKNNGSDDLFLWILLLEKSYKFIINEIPLYIHKYTGENLSDSDDKMNSSSLEIADFLEKVDYVPQTDIDTLREARKLSLELKSDSVLKKAIAIAKYRELFIYLCVNKIKKWIQRK
nr:glycosyltransferase family 2 protein [uncultured Agathobacter sp.]